MKHAEYKKMKRKVDERYQNALIMAEKRRLEELAALETVYRMYHPRRNKHGPVSPSNGIGPATYGSLASAVRESLDYVPETFTKKQIRGAIEQISPEIAANAKDSSITGRLIRLIKQGVIEQAEAGKGSRPSIYRKVRETPKQQETAKEDEGNDNNTDNLATEVF